MIISWMRLFCSLLIASVFSISIGAGESNSIGSAKRITITSNPQPDDQSWIVGRSTVLTWTGPNEAAVQYDVYVGTDRGQLEEAVIDALEYKGRVQTNRFEVTALACDTLYYWRVDGVVNGTAYKGDVWRFYVSAKPLWPGMKAGMPLSDEDFFDALDLRLPGLEKVRDCVDDGDFGNARQEFYIYIRDKFRSANWYEKPSVSDGKLHIPTATSADYVASFITDWWVQKGQRIYGLKNPVKALQAIADEFTLQGKIGFHSTGCIYQFNPKKPFDYRDFDPTDNREYREPLQLYAFYDVRALRDAYFLTGNHEYLRRVEEMMSSYHYWFLGGANSRLALESTGNVLNPWDSWTVSRRLFGYVSFLTFLQKTELDPDLVVKVMKLLLEDERLHVSRGPRWGGNWRQFMCNHGVCVAAMFYEFKESSAWLEDQLERLLLGAKDLYPDGSMGDFSTSYTDGYLMWLSNLGNVIKDFESPHKIVIPPDIASKYEKTIDWELAMRKPDGKAVAFNDDGSHLRPAYYGDLAGVVFDYFGREDLRWFASQGRVGSAPKRSSFPPQSTAPNYCGMLAMRSDWSKDARYMVVDFGPNGGHAHPDYGSFILHAYGADLIDEGGCASYGSEAHTRYSTRPWAHNILGVDGITQPPDRPPIGKPINNWITNNFYDFAWGQSDFGEANEKLQGITHQRAIYFARPDYYLVMDEIRGTGKHQLRHKFQLAWDVKAATNKNSVIGYSKRKAFILIRPFDDRAVPNIIIAQKEPFWDGWMSAISHIDVVEPAPSVVYEENRQLPVYYETLLYPAPAGRKPLLKTLRRCADEGCERGVMLEILPAGRKYRDQYFIGRGEVGQQQPTSFSAKNFSFQGKMVHLRYVGDKIQRIGFVRTLRLAFRLADGETAIMFEKPTDGFITLGQSGTLKNGEVFLDLSNRRQQIPVTIIEENGKQYTLEAELGKEVVVKPD